MESTNFELDGGQRIYIIKFTGTFNDVFFTSDLGKTIKKNGTNKGIEYIKEFDLAKQTFKSISKSDILEFHGWRTESLEILKKHYYFK